MRTLRPHAGTWAEPLEQRRLLVASVGYAITFGELEELDWGQAIAVDAEGNTYVAGTYHGRIDLDPSRRGKYILTNDNDDDNIFLAKYSRRGKLVWGLRFGGTGEDRMIWDPGLGGYIDDRPDLLRIGPSGDIYLAGMFQETATFSGNKQIQLRSHGELDGFVARISPAGKVRWAGNVGGSLDDFVTNIELAPNGDVYFAGTIRISGDINPLRSVYELYEGRGTDDTIVLRLDGGSGALKWHRAYGENNTFEEVMGMAPAADGGVWLAGTFIEKVQFDREDPASEVESIGGMDIYLGHLSPDGQWDSIRRIGGDGEDRLADLAMGPDGDLYMAGNFEDAIDLDGSGPGPTLTATGVDDNAFIARLRTDGTTVWANNFGGIEDDDDAYVRARALAVDRNGNVVVTGEFDETVDFDPTQPGFVLTVDKDDANRLEGEPEETDVFITRIGADGRVLLANRVGGEDGSIAAYDIATDQAGNAHLTGTFSDIVDLAPGPKTLRKRTQDDDGDQDVWILKLRF